VLSSIENTGWEGSGLSVEKAEEAREISREEERLLLRLRLGASEARSHLLMSFGRSVYGNLPRLCKTDRIRALMCMRSGVGGCGNMRVQERETVGMRCRGG
jgi:hypothetical protein